LNNNFSKDAEQDGDDDIIMVTKKPKDLDQQLEMQSIAQEQYALKVEEENRKYSGLTAYERKRMILKELKESNGGTGSSARETRPGSSNKAMSSTPSESKSY